MDAFVINSSLEQQFELFYWQDCYCEAGFVVRYHRYLIVNMVRSGRCPVVLPGIVEFVNSLSPDKVTFVGSGGISVEAFLTMDPQQWLAA